MPAIYERVTERVEKYGVESTIVLQWLSGEGPTAGSNSTVSKPQVSPANCCRTIDAGTLPCLDVNQLIVSALNV